MQRDVACAWLEFCNYQAILKQGVDSRVPLIDALLLYERLPSIQVVDVLGYQVKQCNLKEIQVVSDRRLADPNYHAL